MISVRRIVQGPVLADDAKGRFLRGELDTLYLRYPIVPINPVEAVPDPGVERDGALDGRLGVKLGGEGRLEEHVLHHVRPVAALPLERGALEKHVAEAPPRGAQGARLPGSAGGRVEREPHGAARGVAGRPGLAGAG